ncbi:hypothetical protein TIFTF001_021865 [Ficus carica]|uniref:Uncharacterized protein n=1 Tax=Ficus carica TaxID=3494 RepID=A0AA88DCA4_FICCA|nr:hypothetical protein TIFTF001_021865 [Ficus carica]
MEKPEGYPEVVTEDQAMPSTSCFSGMKDDMSLLESGLLGKCCGLKARIRRALFPYQDQFLDVEFEPRFAPVAEEFEGGRQAVGGEFGGGHVKEVEPPLRNEWIKVRTINPDGDDH